MTSEPGRKCYPGTRHGAEVAGKGSEGWAKVMSPERGFLCPRPSM